MPQETDRPSSPSFPTVAISTPTAALHHVEQRCHRAEGEVDAVDVLAAVEQHVLQLEANLLEVGGEVGLLGGGQGEYRTRMS